jgi:DNA polymerase III subunit epsilon
MIKKLYYSLLTTGTDPDKNGIYHIGAIIEIDGEVKQRINIRCKPTSKVNIDKEFIMSRGMSMEKFKEFPGSKAGYVAFTDMLSLFIDKFNKEDKFFLIGYNNRLMHDRFLKAFFKAHGDDYFGSYFWSNTIDTMSLASMRLMEARPRMANFKLSTVAPKFGITTSATTYDALYDASLIKALYPLLTTTQTLFSNEQQSAA